MFEKLLDYELFLHHDDAKKSSNPITTSVATLPESNINNHNNRRQCNKSQQWRQNSRPNTSLKSQSNLNPNSVNLSQQYNRIGNTSNVFRSKSHNHTETKANFIVGFTTTTKPWIIDSGATHNIMTESHNLQPYCCKEDVSMGDGNRIPISDSCLTQLNASNNIFELTHTLCSPSIKLKHLSISKICQDNLKSIEFIHLTL